jgi:sulfur relay (sulfurtransferase) DsrC/TusE family protein
MSETQEEVKPKAADETVRPTKKQKELLSFIEDFIAEHGYSPSYREIMQGTGHTSVATVSLHVNNLIKRGHLAKRDRSARSLEVVKPRAPAAPPEITPKQLKTSEEKWLVQKVELFFKEAESAAGVTEQDLDKLYVLIGALKVLGLEGAAQAFIARLGELKKRQENQEYSV